MVGEHSQHLLKAEDIDEEPKKKGRQLLAYLLGTSVLLALTSAAHFVTPGVAQVGGTAKLHAKTDVRSSKESPKYYWQSARGNMGNYSNSPYPARFDFKKPSWTWSYNCCSGCTWCTYMLGVVIDRQKGIYVSAADGVRKFNPSGKLLWKAHRQDRETFARVGALYDGAVYQIAVSGRAFALSMDTGKEIWSTQMGSRTGISNGQIAVQHGVVIHAVQRNAELADTKLVALNTTDGNILWTYEPESPLWNFGATFPGDGTFVYQTYDGKVHRNFVNSGALLWKNGGVPGSWTDGQCNLGSNGMVYGVSNSKDARSTTKVTGFLSAYRLSDGYMTWQRKLTRPPNSIPAVGMLAGQTKLSVVIPVGRNDQKGAEVCVYAFHAETGEDQWVFKGPMQVGSLSVSDGNPWAVSQRLYNWVRPVVVPNSWGAPAIDGRGAVFVGGITGHVLRLMDLNQDGEVAGHGEVAFMTTDADMPGSSSPAMAPGMFVLGNSHYLYAWNY